MRINQYIAKSLGIGRRKADELIKSGTVTVNGRIASLGQQIDEQDTVKVGSTVIKNTEPAKLIALHKPPGYVCSQNGQGATTIYELLPRDLAKLKLVGRLDKDSSGLLLLSSDGALIEQLSHPKHQKEKRYEVTLDKPLSKHDFTQITEKGITIDNKQPSILMLTALKEDKTQHQHFRPECRQWSVRLHEGRNRQIRKTFEALGYRVNRLHRVAIGPVLLQQLPEGNYRKINLPQANQDITV